jgi:hypothetical protein
MLGILLNLGVGVVAVAARMGAGTLMYGFVGFFFLTILLYIGLAQSAWIVPFYFTYRNRGARETATGIAVAGGITFLVWVLILLFVQNDPAGL